MSVKKDSSIIKPEDIYKYLSENESYTDIGRKSYDLNRASATSALKSMIRERYTPAVLRETNIVKAMVVDAQDKSAGTIPVAYTDALFGTSTDGHQIVRIRVLSDPRHYWLPMPVSPEDPMKVFHPMVRHELGIGLNPLVFGDLVEVSFNDPKSQFTSTGEIGKVVTVLDGSLGSSLENSSKGKFLGKDCEIKLSEDQSELTITKCGIYTKSPRIISIPAFSADQTDKDGYERPRMPVGNDVKGAALTKVVAHKTRGGLMTAPYGQERKNKDGSTRLHHGTDFRARLGTPILATLDGYATTGYANGYGYYVVIEHTDYQQTAGSGMPPEDVTIFSLYGHVADHNFVKLIPPGGKIVQRGYPIALSGGSGWGSPHLHFEITYSLPGVANPNKAAVDYQDPVNFLKIRLLKKAQATGDSVASVEIQRQEVLVSDEVAAAEARNNQRKAAERANLNRRGLPEIQG
jgi:murein DD-endopeptidase MepM/ murein hydrolase activator NlpD